MCRIRFFLQNCSLEIKQMHWMPLAIFAHVWTFCNFLSPLILFCFIFLLFSFIHWTNNNTNKLLIVVLSLYVDMQRHFMHDCIVQFLLWRMAKFTLYQKTKNTLENGPRACVPNFGFLWVYALVLSISHIRHKWYLYPFFLSQRV